MSALILDGKIVRDQIAESLNSQISLLTSRPKLVIIQVGDNPESNTYIGQKIKFGEKVGAPADLIKFPQTATQNQVASKIIELNKDKEVHGIIVQMPIPQSLDKDALIELINPKKDVDGLTSTNQKLLEENSPDAIIPATAKGVISILNFYKIKVGGKKTAVVGRSKLVGTPVAALLRNMGASVEIGHSKTEDLTKVTKGADIIVVAVGKPNLITKDHVSPGQVIIDVGINIVNPDEPSTINHQHSLVGDVNFEEVSPIVSAITPVPGGIGPMTVASLFENLLEAYNKQNA